jgi:hypothetical protein
LGFDDQNFDCSIPDEDVDSNLCGGVKDWRVQKYFTEQGWCSGVVVGHSVIQPKLGAKHATVDGILNTEPQPRLYQVMYEHGDQEDASWDSLSNILLPQCSQRHLLRQAIPPNATSTEVDLKLEAEKNETPENAGEHNSSVQRIIEDPDSQTQQKKKRYQQIINTGISYHQISDRFRKLLHIRGQSQAAVCPEVLL